MPESILRVVYLDEYHAGDRLLIDRLGRGIAARPGLRLLVVHDPSEAVRSAQEGAGVLDASTTSVGAAVGPVERAVRVSNKRIVAQLTEAGVPAAGVLGVDRGLMKGGLVTQGGASWLEGLCALGTVPVVSPMAPGGGSGRHILYIDARKLLTSLIPLLASEAVVILLNKRDKTYVNTADGQRLTGVVGSDTILMDYVHDPAILAGFGQGPARIMVTNIDGLLGSPVPVGTHIVGPTRPVKSS